MGQVAIRNVYVDYLLSTSGQITSTDLSKVLEGQYSHDQITRMLSSGEVNDKTLYLKGKKFIKAKAIKGVVTLAIDDSIQHKPHMKINGLAGWHYDHTEGWCIKGINFVSGLWSDEEASVPLSVQMVEKERRWNEKKGKEEWKAIKNKNELFREMAFRLTRNRQVDYVLSDSWYSGAENMCFLVQECEVYFVLALKCNRTAARNEKDAKKGNFKPLEEMRLGKGAVKLYLKGLDFPVLVIKKVFKNEDGSSGTLYLATSDLELSYEEVLNLYKRRWKVEEYHKSLKSNCSLGKCQASSHNAQKSHFYLSAFAFLLLEKTKAKEDKNHFALSKELNILTVKYSLKVIKKYLHTKHKNMPLAA